MGQYSTSLIALHDGISQRMGFYNPDALNPQAVFSGGTQTAARTLELFFYIRSTVLPTPSNNMTLYKAKDDDGGAAARIRYNNGSWRWEQEYYAFGQGPGGRLNIALAGWSPRGDTWYHMVVRQGGGPEGGLELLIGSTGIGLNNALSSTPDQFPYETGGLSETGFRLFVPGTPTDTCIGWPSGQTMQGGGSNGPQLVSFGGAVTNAGTQIANNSHWRGGVAEFRLWNVRRTDTEIIQYRNRFVHSQELEELGEYQQISGTALSTAVPNLLTCYRFNTEATDVQDCGRQSLPEGLYPSQVPFTNRTQQALYVASHPFVLFVPPGEDITASADSSMRLEDAAPSFAKELPVEPDASVVELERRGLLASVAASYEVDPDPIESTFTASFSLDRSLAVEDPEFFVETVADSDVAEVLQRDPGRNALGFETELSHFKQADRTLDGMTESLGSAPSLTREVAPEDFPNFPGAGTVVITGISPGIPSFVHNPDAEIEKTRDPASAEIALDQILEAQVLETKLENLDSRADWARPESEAAATVDRSRTLESEEFASTLLPPPEQTETFERSPEYAEQTVETLASTRLEFGASPNETSVAVLLESLVVVNRPKSEDVGPAIQSGSSVSFSVERFVSPEDSEIGLQAGGLSWSVESVYTEEPDLFLELGSSASAARELGLEFVSEIALESFDELRFRAATLKIVDYPVFIQVEDEAPALAFERVAGPSSSLRLFETDQATYDVERTYVQDLFSETPADEAFAVAAVDRPSSFADVFQLADEPPTVTLLRGGDRETILVVGDTLTIDLALGEKETFVAPEDLLLASFDRSVPVSYEISTDEAAPILSFERARSMQSLVPAFVDVPEYDTANSYTREPESSLLIEDIPPDFSLGLSLVTPGDDLRLLPEEPGISIEYAALASGNYTLEDQATATVGASGSTLTQLILDQEARFNLSLVHKPFTNFLIPEDPPTITRDFPVGADTDSRLVPEAPDASVAETFYFLIPDEIGAGVGVAVNKLIPEEIYTRHPLEPDTLDYQINDPDIIEIIALETIMDLQGEALGGVTVPLSGVIREVSLLYGDMSKLEDYLSVLDIWNTALVRLAASTIDSLTSNQNEAVKMRAAWDQFRVQFLVEHTWNGAKKTAEIARFVNSDGTTVTPPLRWRYTYALPEDYLRAITLAGMANEPRAAVIWEVETRSNDLGDQRVLHTNAPPNTSTGIELEYIFDIGDKIHLLGPKTRQALARSLAWYVAENFGKGIEDIQQLEKEARQAMSAAKGIDGQEMTAVFFSETGLSAVRDRERFGHGSGAGGYRGGYY